MRPCSSRNFSTKKCPIRDFLWKIEERSSQKRVKKPNIWPKRGLFSNSGNGIGLYRYRICDNYVAFCLKYIAPRRDQINSGALGLPSGWQSIMGLAFESLVINHSRELHSLLRISPDELICAGPYFQTRTKKREGCQIDFLIQTKFDTLYLCEIKFSKKELGTEVLIHVNGVTDELLSREYFAHVVSFADFLS